MGKEKIVICKHCGAEIAASAKTCPKCGGKNKKPIYKRVWFWILIALIVLGGGGALGGSNDSGSTASNDAAVEENASATEEQKEEQKIEYKDVKVDEMTEALNNNAAAASDTYKGNYYAVTGRLRTIDSDGKYISLTDVDDELSVIGVSCYLQNDEQREIVKKLSKDQTVTVKGKITDVGEILGYSLKIDEIVE